MKIIAALIIFGLGLTLLAPRAQADAMPPNPALETLWLSCTQNTDCSNVALGCAYWQPVNQKYAADMTQKYPSSSCNGSAFMGPQPSAACQDYRCVSFYGLNYWRNLKAGSPEAMIVKNHLLQKQLEKCIMELGRPAAQTVAVTTTINSRDFDAARTEFIGKVDASVAANPQADDLPLQWVFDTTVSCQNVFEKARPAQK